MKQLRFSFLFVLLSTAFIPLANAQYFGKNKPKYRDFDFKVQQTPHFEIYNYMKNKEAMDNFTKWTEQWYELHSYVLQDAIKFKNPIILYNDHADFQQTTAIQGSLGVGTGGVTEAFKNRVVLPWAMSNQQTYHVLGHEMVHAFQYNLVINGDSTSLQNIQNLPLWMVEGLAEYMSIGRKDSHTSMWMRDAILNKDIPSLKDLNNMYKYFPYRYGQAFWAFVTGVYGDNIIRPLYMNTAKYGLDPALKMTLGVDAKTLSGMWKSSLENYYAKYLADRKEKPQGKAILTEKNAGNMNISPVISPNGKYLIFLSEKNVLSTDLFLADARTGKILKNVAQSDKDGHIDDFNYIESSGTWSPDSKSFAFVAFSKGKNILVVKDVFSGKTIQKSELKGVPAFTNPTWHPKKKAVVVSGLVEGQVDLYEFDLKSKKVTQVTNDVYSEMHPSFSPDGTKLLFSSDQTSWDKGKDQGKWTFDIAIMNYETKEKQILPVFYGADNMNPVMDDLGNIYFLSNRDGFRNVYRYENDGKVYQITDLLTGATGITEYAPAISIERSANKTRMVYSHYYNHRYNIYEAGEEDFLKKEVNPNEVNFEASLLPAVNPDVQDFVNTNLKNADKEFGTNAMDGVKEIPYKPKFRLDYIGGSTGVGVGANNLTSATGMMGAVQAIFSDILGNNQMFTNLSINGDILDAGGQFAYLNSKKRWQFGGAFTHIPWRSGNYGVSDVNLNINGTSVPAIRERIVLMRQYETSLSGFVYYPFSVTKRFEVGTTGTLYNYRFDQYDTYYRQVGNSYAYLGDERNRLKNLEGVESSGLVNLSTALVGDNSTFGGTAPLRGWRYRVGAEQYFGRFNFSALTLDYRRYFNVKPFTFAIRGMHLGRYGIKNDGSGSVPVSVQQQILYGQVSPILPIYLGNPSLIRGYGAFIFGNPQKFLDNAFGDDLNDENLNLIGRMSGDRVFVGNFEVRVPFTGPKRLGLIKFPFLLTDLNLFADYGVAWTKLSDFKSSTAIADRVLPVASVGASLRANILGYLVVEPYYARPLQKNAKWIFGFNLIPGW